MPEVSVRELRNSTSDVVRRVEDGETLTLTVHGRPVADIVPHSRRRDSMPAAELIDRFAARSTGEAPASLPRHFDEVTTDDVVEDMERHRRRIAEG